MLRFGRTLLLAAGATLILCAIGTRAFTQGDAGIIRLPPEIVFKAPLEGPPQTIVLFGDPNKPGLFVSRVRISRRAGRTRRIGIRMRRGRPLSFQAPCISVPVIPGTKPA